MSTNSEESGSQLNKNEDLNPIIEIYKMYAEMADNISERRDKSNVFFLSLNSAVLGFGGILTSNINPWTLNLLSMVSFWVCIIWFTIILQYRKLNEKKFEVINNIEKQLPISPYTDEKKLLDAKKGNYYISLTKIEILIPLLFCFIIYFII